MKNDEFDKLFKYMEGRFDSIDKQLNEVATKDEVTIKLEKQITA